MSTAVLERGVPAPAAVARDAHIAGLEERIAVVCGHLNVLHAQLVAIVGEALASGAWQQSGIRSPEHWLAWKSGLSNGRARQLVAIAARREELPATVAAFANGELAVDQVAVVAAHARSHHDSVACELAKSATVSQLRAGLSRYVHEDGVAGMRDRSTGAAGSPGSPGAAEEAGAPGEAGDATMPEPDDGSGPEGPGGDVDPLDVFAAGFGDDGRYRLQVECNALDGSVIDKAIAFAQHHLFHSGRPDAGGVAALVEVAQRALAGPEAVARRDLFRTYVHLDTGGDGGPARAWLNGGPRLPQVLADALLCDGIVKPLWLSEGRPVNVGRSRRTTPDHTRRLVLDRDRVCRHPSCSVTRYLEVHHVDHWSQQRRGTDTGNLVALCPFHHDAHHRGAFGLVGNADDPAGLVFRDARGRPLPSGPRPVPPTGPPAPPPGHAYRHPSGERANWRWFDLPPAPVALAAPAPPALAAAPVSVGTTAPPAPVAPVGLAGSPSGRSRAPASERLPEQLTNS